MMPAWTSRKREGTGDWAGYARGIDRRLAAAASRLREAVGLLVCVIRAAHERSRLDVAKPEVERDGLQLAELVGRVVAHHLEV